MRTNRFLGNALSPRRGSDQDVGLAAYAHTAAKLFEPHIIDLDFRSRTSGSPKGLWGPRETQVVAITEPLFK